jgi:hypothetical protein
MRRALRAHRTAIALALATAGTLAVTGIALAAASSTVVFSFSPSNPHGELVAGQLSFGTHTEYTGATDQTTRIQLSFDDDFQFKPNSIPRCRPAEISGNITMQEAMQACGPPAGAAKNAYFSPSTAEANGTALFNLGTEFPTACVLAFNGSGQLREILLFIRVKIDQHLGPIDCGSPTTNTDGDQSFLVEGDLKANPAIGGDFTDPDNCSAPDPRRGCQLDLTDVTNPPLRLVDLNVELRRANYFRARCIDPPAGNRRWNLQATFTYATPPGTQTVNASRACT